MLDHRGVLRWEDPPPLMAPEDKNTRRAWAVVVRDLRSQPREWGVIAEGPGADLVFARVRSGQAWWAPKGSYQVCARWVDGLLTAYARYLGEPPTVQDQHVMKES